MMKSILAFGLLSISLAVVGCAKSDVATVAPTAQSQAAPAPKNLTPEQKAAYDKAVQSAGPTATPPPGR